MKVHTSSKLYLYATFFQFVKEPKTGCELLLGALSTTLVFPAAIVACLAGISSIGGFVLLLLGIPEPEALVEAFAVGFGAGCATIAAVGSTLFLVNLLCRRVEVVSD